LPLNARHYIEFVEGFTDVPIAYISTGGRREQTLRK
ncbi:adenylosuccinate synthetase, partial [Moraxella sp.]|nr:adenylosuccinate synthetase [Moraxella sp.]